MADDIQQEPQGEALDKPTASVSADELAKRDTQIRKLKDENAERRVAANKAIEENDALKAQLSTLETVQTQISELQKRLDAESDARKNAELQALRLQVATSAGIPPELASRLQGSTPEELLADAQSLAGILPKSVVVPKVGQGAPVPPVSRANEILARMQGKNTDVFNPESHKSLKGGIVGE